MSLASGTRLGPYEIIARLGSGGMGDVYKARDTRAGGTKTAVSHGGAGLARWSRDGRELFYVTGDRRLVTVPVRTSPMLELGSPTRLFALRGKGWVDFDVAQDGKPFLSIIREIIGSDLPLTALMNAYR